MPVQMVRVAGTDAVVPADASDAIEISVLRARASREMGCDDLTLERTGLDMPVVRVRGCGKQRVYARAVRGYLPGYRLPADPQAPVELAVVDFVDLARAEANDPFAGVERLPGETRESPFGDAVDPYDHGFDPARSPLSLTHLIALDEVGAAKLSCPRDDVVPLLQLGHRHREPRAVGCGRSVDFTGGYGPPRVNPFSNAIALDTPVPADLFRPWVPAEHAYRGGDAVTLHVKSADLGSVGIAVAVPASDPDFSPEWRHVCNAPCDLPLDPRAAYRVQAPTRSRDTLASAPFQLPHERAATAVVSPAHDHTLAAYALLGSGLTGVGMGGLWLGLSELSGGQGDTAPVFRGLGIFTLAAGAVTALVGLWFALDSTKVHFER